MKNLKAGVHYPEWMTEAGLKTLSSGYLLKEETPKDMYKRVANAAAQRINKPELADKFFDYIWKGWLCPATPVLCNMGTERGLPISCYSLHVGDSVDSIFMKQHELAMLSKNGGGVGIYAGDIRGRNAEIKNNGTSEGVVPWIKCFDSTTIAVSQGSTRRGSSSVYLPVNHVDIEEFLQIRRPKGDINRQCLNIHHAVSITDDFMAKVEAGDKNARNIWKEILKTRVETGEPYIFYYDNVNKANPPAYINNNLNVKTSNICFSGDTIVAVADGRNGVPIKQLALESHGKIKFPVYSARPVKYKRNSYGKRGGGTIVTSNWKEEIKYAVAFKTGTSKLLKVTLNNGDSFKCTENHRLALFSGNYVEAKDSLNCELESFFTFTNKMKENRLKYRTIRSLTGEQQYSKIWNFYNPLDKRKPNEEIDHIDDDGGDFIYNLRKLSAKEHHRIMSEKMKKKNPMKNLGEDISRYRNNKLQETLGINNPKFCGIDNFKLIEIAKQCYNELGKFDSKIYHSILRKKYPELPGFFSKYRFNKSFVEFVSYVKGEKEYKGEYENNLFFVKKNDVDADRKNYINKFFYERIDNNITKKGLIVVKIEECGEEDVYDLKVEDNSNFYILTSTDDKNYMNCQGVLVHNCTEIMGFTDVSHTFVCCLSSLNVVRWEEWKNTDLPYIAIYFLEGIMQEFLDKAKKMMGFESAIRFAEKSRMLGLGILGYHTLLQSRNLPFDSLQSMFLNRDIFKKMQHETDKASKDLAKEFGEPEWCKGTGFRHTHRMAVAPTISNSKYSGDVSSGIEPITANAYADKTAKGVFTYKNPILERLLEKKNKNNSDVWNTIIVNEGSVQHLDFLSEDEKQIFLTAREINQFAIIRQAADRQKYIDQAQSINLFFPINSTPKYISEVHIEAWKLGIKTLYYCRTGSVIKGDSSVREYERKSTECAACEG